MTTPTVDASNDALAAPALAGSPPCSRATRPCQRIGWRALPLGHARYTVMT
ncbi:hypothetical protein [Achromobacter aloeverae]